MCVCVAFFALTLWYILLSFPFYSIRWFIHVIVHVALDGSNSSSFALSWKALENTHRSETKLVSMCPKGTIIVYVTVSA